MRRILATFIVLTLIASASAAGWIVYHGDPAVSPYDRVRAVVTGTPAHPTTRADVRKTLGRPVMGEPAGSRWAYADLVVDFDGDKVVAWEQPRQTFVPERSIKTIDVNIQSPQPLSRFRGVVSPVESRRLAHGTNARIHGRVFATPTDANGDDYRSDEAYRRDQRNGRGTNARFDYLRQSIHRGNQRNRNFSHRGTQQWWR